MKIELKEITIRDLVADYADDSEGGVRGYGGRLDIRPPYQREFIYKDKQRDAVIDTVRRSFPLNVMYWAVRDDGTFEIIDGQQRTISVCQYVSGVFSISNLYFHNLSASMRAHILDYRLTVYLCSGTDSERLDWFRTINIAGEKLTEQELRNAVYSGPWVTDAKKHFSKTGCAAYTIGGDYLRGVSIRQDYLETALKWLSEDEIEDYMAVHHHDSNANELWLYFHAVIAWVKATFPKYRREMKRVAWGELYNEFKVRKLDPEALEVEISRLMGDEDVTRKVGIYRYVLSREEKWLNVRAFTLRQKREAYERQEGVCPTCGKDFQFEDMEGDHITPWCRGGKTVSDNCQMLCRKDNRRKTGR
jgi:hypothetical protein